MSQKTRRDFLIAGAAVAGATLFDLRRLLAESVPGPQREYGWFPMGIQSYSLRHLKVDDALTTIHDLGIHQVELFSAHLALDASDDTISEMKRKTRRLEIRMTAHGVNHFSKDHEANRRIFDFANRAGIRNLSADPDPDTETFDSLEKLVKDSGIRIAIHNHGPGHRYGEIAQIQKVLEGRHPWIGVCADLGHFIRSAVDPVEAIRAFKGRLWGIHLKDFAEEKRDTRGVVLGKGHLDLVAVFRALREVEFPADGGLSLEYEEPDPLPAIKECFAAASEAARAAMRA